MDGTNPGINADEIEALLDLEWSHALASGAAQVFYLDDHTNAATGISIVDSLQRAVADRSCSVISVSFTLCGNLASFMTQTFHPIASQAAAQGQSIFVSSG